MLSQPLIIPRGGVFYAHAWALVDSVGNPIRDTTGLTVVAKARRWRSADEVLYAFATSIVLLTIPGYYDGEAVAAAQLNAMTPTQTLALPDVMDGAVYDVLVNGEPIVGDLISAPLMVSRT